MTSTVYDIAKTIFEEKSAREGGTMWYDFGIGYDDGQGG